MPDEVREHSLRILKAVHEHVKGRVGETIPLSEVVRQAGLQHYGPAYNAAVEDSYRRGGARGRRPMEKRFLWGPP
jgi:hypothetical protein